MDNPWVIMPWLNAPAMTWQAVEDCLAQTLPGVRVLLVDQGASKADRDAIDAAIDRRRDHRVLVWHFLPMLPSLSACWNRALRFVWEVGGTEALVVNNDIRLHRTTYAELQGVMGHTDALFVSAVGVREGQFDPAAVHEAFLTPPDAQGWGHPVAPGGPDFSCFLISQIGHERYPFDEGFQPAYHEDLDAHRRYMLGGDGARIFSVNLPFLHYASGTIKEYSPEARAAFNRKFAACKAYYTAKWGGPPNEETFDTPFGMGGPCPFIRNWAEETEGPVPVTTPQMQEFWRVQRRPTDAGAIPAPALILDQDEGVTAHVEDESPF